MQDNIEDQGHNNSRGDDDGGRLATCGQDLLDRADNRI